jgi:hypothetical protein
LHGKLLTVILFIAFLIVSSLGITANAHGALAENHSDRFNFKHQLTWSKIYSFGPLFSIEQTRDGGYITAGSSVLKLDALGNVQWHFFVGGPCWPFAHSIRQTFDGGYVLVGNCNVDVSVIRLDSHGEIIWQKAYGGPNPGPVLYSLAQGMAIEQTSDYGFIVVGDLILGNDNGGWIFKLDAAGSMIWQKWYNGTSFDAMDKTSNGFVIAGPAGNVLRIDSLGNILWQKAYVIPNASRGIRFIDTIKSTSDGGSLIGGMTEQLGLGGDAWVLKIDGNGNLQWQNAFYSRIPFIDEVYSVAVVHDGYVLAGVYDFGAAGMLIKLDTLGNMIWHRAIGAPMSGTIYSMDTTFDHGFVIAGTNSSIPNGGSQPWVAKLDSTGFCCSSIMNRGNSLFDVTSLNTNATIVITHIIPTMPSTQTITIQPSTVFTLGSAATLLCNPQYAHKHQSQSDS